TIRVSTVGLLGRSGTVIPDSTQEPTTVLLLYFSPETSRDDQVAVGADVCGQHYGGRGQRQALFQALQLRALLRLRRDRGLRRGLPSRDADALGKEPEHATLLRCLWQLWVNELASGRLYRVSLLRPPPQEGDARPRPQPRTKSALFPRFPRAGEGA